MLASENVNVSYHFLIVTSFLEYASTRKSNSNEPGQSGAATSGQPKNRVHYTASNSRWNAESANSAEPTEYRGEVCI